ADVRISAREMKMARSLVEQFSEDYEPDRFVDEYQEQLQALIEAKLEHGDVIDTDATFGRVSEDETGGGDVIDLMEALKRSVDSKRSAVQKPAEKRTSRRGRTKKSDSASAKSSRSSAKSSSSKDSKSS